MLLDYQQIIGRAAWARRKAGLEGTDPPYSTRRVMNQCFPDIAVSGTELPIHIIEMARADGDRRALYYNRNVNHSAQRIGIAHGLYHHWTDLRGDVGLRECNLAMRELGRIDGHRDPIEVACDLFAAELLVPLDVLDGHAPDPIWGQGALSRDALEDECDTLASRFNVPKGFIKWRLNDLHAIRRSHYNPNR